MKRQEAAHSLLPYTVLRGICDGDDSAARAERLQKTGRGASPPPPSASLHGGADAALQVGVVRRCCFSHAWSVGDLLIPVGRRCKTHDVGSMLQDR